MADRGYEYDAYEKAPKPQHLTTEEAAARERRYKALHEQAMGGPHDTHHAHSMEASTKHETPEAGAATERPGVLLGLIFTVFGLNAFYISFPFRQCRVSRDSSWESY